MKYSKKIVTMVIALNIPFTVAVLYLNSRGMMVSDELVRGWFRFTGIELVAIAGIKVAEVVRDGHG